MALKISGSDDMQPRCQPHGINTTQVSVYASRLCTAYHRITLWRKNLKCTLPKKGNPKTHHLISLPNNLPSLSPSSVRVRTRVLSLTQNNVTYIERDALKWWAAYPAPDNVQGIDSANFTQGRGWGYAVVLESSVDGLPPGSAIYGYVPFSTLPYDLHVSPAALAGHFCETTEARQIMPAFYNRYALEPSFNGSAPDVESGWMSLLRPMFETGLALSDYVFGPSGRRTYPVVKETAEFWDREVEGDVSDAVVLVFAAGGESCNYVCVVFEGTEACGESHDYRCVFRQGESPCREDGIL